MTPPAGLHAFVTRGRDSVRDIPADRIRRVLSFAELAGASAA
jgi:hypothetical protein